MAISAYFAVSLPDTGVLFWSSTASTEVAELLAVLLAQFDLAARQAVLVAAAAGPEQRDGPFVLLLQVDLREAGVVAAEQQVLHRPCLWQA